MHHLQFIVTGIFAHLFAVNNCTHSSHHLGDFDFLGTHFGVVLVVYNSKTKYLQYRYSPRDSTDIEYLHTLMTLRSSNQPDVMSAINDLNITLENSTQRFSMSSLLQR
jgi:hypothetical protein